MFDREELLKRRQELAQSRNREKKRFPFGIARTKNLAPGEYRMRPAPTRAMKNEKGVYCFETITIPEFDGLHTKYVLLHPNSLLNPHGPEAYWGIVNFLKEVRAMRTEDDEPVFNALPDDFKETIKTMENFWPRYQIPVFMTAEADPNSPNPDYPDYYPSRGKMLDILFEFNAQTKFAENFIDLICADDIDVFDSKRGYELIYDNRNSKAPSIRLGKQVPLTSEQEAYLDNGNYPDLYETAKRGGIGGKTPRYLSPGKQKELVEKCRWWKAFANMGFELEEPVSATANVKIAGKKKSEPKPAEPEESLESLLDSVPF
jgi:hypothetical protein